MRIFGFFGFLISTMSMIGCAVAAFAVRVIENFAGPALDLSAAGHDGGTKVFASTYSDPHVARFEAGVSRRSAARNV